MSHPGAPTEVMLLSDCVAGRSPSPVGAHWLPWIVCTVVFGWSERRCAASCSCCVVVSAYSVRRDDPSSTDDLTGLEALLDARLYATHCDYVLGYFYDLAACFECFLFFLLLYHWTHWV